MRAGDGKANRCRYRGRKMLVRKKKRTGAACVTGAVAVSRSERNSFVLGMHSPSGSREIQMERRPFCVQNQLVDNFFKTSSPFTKFFVCWSFEDATHYKNKTGNSYFFLKRRPRKIHTPRATGTVLPLLSSFGLRFARAFFFPRHTTAAGAPRAR